MDSMEKQFSGITPKDAYIEERNRVIIRTSILGITANVVLALLKALVGMATHSIAITLDAVNNFTDAGSSVITIAGTKLASKKPDKKHPWGHGRIEYLSAMLLGALVLSAGISSLIEAVRKIIDPRTPEYSSVSLILVAVCVLVKIFLGRYVRWSIPAGMHCWTPWSPHQRWLRRCSIYFTGSLWRPGSER